MLCAFFTPLLTGKFEALLHNVSVSSFDGPGANQVALLKIGVVLHAVYVFLVIAYHRLFGFAGLFVHGHCLLEGGDKLLYPSAKQYLFLCFHPLLFFFFILVLQGRVVAQLFQGMIEVQVCTACG